MLSLYIHIPFCIRKCPYCGFYSTEYTEQGGNDYLDALRVEASGYRDAFRDRVFGTVYLGGGTPTALSPEQMNGLIGTVRDHFRVAPDAEWTVEANPNTALFRQLASMRDAGINRLSLGVQSFSDRVLRTLGRLHSAEEAAEAFRTARSAGFRNIGIDLIYGVPGQSEEEWDRTLDRALSLQPEHISVYSLSLDEGSRFRKDADAGRFVLPGDDLAATMYEQAVEKLDRAGYTRYELSNFALPGNACRHNMNYWERGEYLGLGPGAWSFLDSRRYHDVADVRAYSARMKAGLSVITGEEAVDFLQAANEAMMLGLRTSRGVDLAGFGRDFGRDSVTQLLRKAAPLMQAGLLVEDDGRIRLAGSGFLLANEALARLAL